MSFARSACAAGAAAAFCAAFGLAAAQQPASTPVTHSSAGHAAEPLNYRAQNAWPGACALGKNQTPIDLDEKALIKAQLPPLHISYTGKRAAVFQLNHHLVPQVDYVEAKNYADKSHASGNTLVVDGHTFDLKQFHFHTPSENLINGKPLAMEAHLVHSDEKGQAILVLAVMLELGHTHAKLAELWQHLPTHASPKQSVTFNPADLLPGHDQHAYYRFNGSLTTPPCGEGVRWIVLKARASVDAHQVKALIEALPGKAPNARARQEVNARPVLH